MHRDHHQLRVRRIYLAFQMIVIAALAPAAEAGAPGFVPLGAWVGR